MTIELGLGLGAFALSAPLAWYARGTRTNPLRAVRLRRAIAMLATLAVLCAPWAFAPTEPRLRFAAALIALMLAVRIWESVTGSRFSAGALKDVRFFLWSHFGLPDLAAKPERENRAREDGLRRLLRALFKVACCFGLLFAVSDLPAFYESQSLWLLRQCWLLTGAYLASSAVADVWAGTLELLSAYPAEEVFKLPIAATSPRDFWSNRWNLMFRGASRRLVFRPLLRRGWRPHWAALAVFCWSAAAHEYLVFAALGVAALGWMTLFFLLQAVAVVWFERLRKPWGRTPSGLAIASHWAWMALTSPLFFLPVLQIFPAFEWRILTVLQSIPFLFGA